MKTKTNSHLRKRSAPFWNRALGVIPAGSRSDLASFLWPNRPRRIVLYDLRRVNDSLEVVDFLGFIFARRRCLALLLANASKGRKKRKCNGGGEKKRIIGDKSTTRLRKRFHAYRGEWLPRFMRSFFFGDGASGVSVDRGFCNPGHSTWFSPAWWAFGFLDLDL